jgi:hypothetical protein
VREEAGLGERLHGGHDLGELLTLIARVVLAIGDLPPERARRDGGVRRGFIGAAP